MLAMKCINSLRQFHRNFLILYSIKIDASKTKVYNNESIITCVWCMYVCQFTTIIGVPFPISHYNMRVRNRVEEATIPPHHILFHRNTIHDQKP